MKVLVTGAGGQLGQDVVRVLGEQGIRAVGFTRHEWDVTDPDRTSRMLEEVEPDAVVHCAAYTRVDDAERDPEGAYRGNVHASRLLAGECARRGIRLIHISTDYVFDGSKREGYVEEDPPHPLNVYGKTKRLAEKWVLRLHPGALVLRTSWLYGIHGKNFVYAILERARRGEPLSVVNDQEGCPTHTLHLARLIARVLGRPISGIVHAAAGGRSTWHGFAEEIVRLAGCFSEVRPISTSGAGRPARRPACSVLLSRRLEREGIEPLPHWKEGIAEFFKRLEEGSASDD